MTIESRPTERSLSEQSTTEETGRHKVKEKTSRSLYYGEETLQK